jgi:hypothetical protein
LDLLKKASRQNLAFLTTFLVLMADKIKNKKNTIDCHPPVDDIFLYNWQTIYWCKKS